MRKTALEGSMKNVADGLREEGRWQEAEEMHGKALEGPWARPSGYLEQPVGSGCLPAETGRSDCRAFQGCAFEGSVFSSEAS